MSSGPFDPIVEAIAEAVARKLKGELSEKPLLLDIKAAAGLIGIGSSTLRERMTAGDIPKRVIRRLGTRLYIYRPELEKWLMDQR